MISNRPGRKRDDEAVTAVVGAILVTVLLVSLMTTIQLRHVPVWESNREASLMLHVENQMGSLKSELDRHVFNDTLSLVGSPVTIGQERSSMFSRQGTANSLAITGADQTISMTAEDALVVKRNGTWLSTVANTWTDINTVTTVRDVARIQALRLRLDEVSVNQSSRDVKVELSDAAGPAGSFTFAVDPAGLGQLLLRYETRNAADEVVARRVEQLPDQVFNDFFVNPLNRDYSFGQVLAAAGGRFVVTITHSTGFDGDYVLVYTEIDSEGRRGLASTTGLVANPLQLAYPAKSMVFTGRNTHFVDQTMTLENGALVLD